MLGIIILLLSLLTLKREMQWQSPLLLYGHDLEYSKSSPILNNYYGTTLAENGHFNQAEGYLQKAITLDPLGGYIAITCSQNGMNLKKII